MTCTTAVAQMTREHSQEARTGLQIGVCAAAGPSKSMLRANTESMPGIHASAEGQVQTTHECSMHYQTAWVKPAHPQSLVSLMACFML